MSENTLDLGGNWRQRRREVLDHCSDNYRSLDARDQVLRALLLARDDDDFRRRLWRAFSPVDNPRRLAGQGGQPMNGLSIALNGASALLGGVIWPSTHVPRPAGRLDRVSVLGTVVDEPMAVLMRQAIVAAAPAFRLKDQTPEGLRRFRAFADAGRAA